MPFKRKSESAVSANEPAATPSKRSRNTTVATPTSAAVPKADATPQTGEKRGRGRPRKNPESVTPKPAYDGPKRGRGRPRKDASVAKKQTVTSSGPQKGRGRPRKDSGQTPSATPVSNKKDGRGRPRKDTGDTTASTPLTKKAGRGRPRKTPLVNGGAEPDTKAASPEAASPEGASPEGASPKEASQEGASPEAASPEGASPEGASPEKLSAENIETNRSFWLMKAEPESRLEKGKDVKFSIDDLAAADKPEPWDGVRNHVAKNLMRDMKKGDYAFFYHSNCKVPGIVGVMEVVQEHSVDESAFDPEHPYYDPKSDRADPRWVVVHVAYRRRLEKQVTLQDLKTHSEAGKPLESLQMIKQGRLSVSSVTPAQWRYILELAGEEPKEEFTDREASVQE